jgi:predicted RNA polymerase sigma factor
VLAALIPDQAEVHGLVALMEFQSSRFGARTDAEGQPVLLEDQDRTKWDRAQIRRGVAALERAAETLQRNGIGWGPYGLQAALAECHAVSPTAADTDWKRIVALYDGLLKISPSPVIELNRAVAVAMAGSPAEALDIVDGIAGLDDSYLLPSVRGELLVRMGRRAEAAAEFDTAAELASNGPERDVLADKAAQAREKM